MISLLNQLFIYAISCKNISEDGACSPLQSGKVTFVSLGKNSSMPLLHIHTYDTSCKFTIYNIKNVDTSFLFLHLDCGI